MDYSEDRSKTFTLASKRDPVIVPVGQEMPPGITAVRLIIDGDCIPENYGEVKTYRTKAAATRAPVLR